MQHMADRLRNKANAQHICPWMTCKPVDNSFHSFISDKLTDSLIQLNQLLYKLHFVNFIFNKGRRCWWGWWWWWCFSCCHQTHDTSFECNSNVPLTLLSTGFRYRGCYNTDTMLSLHPSNYLSQMSTDRQPHTDYWSDCYKEDDLNTFQCSQNSIYISLFCTALKLIDTLTTYTVVICVHFLLCGQNTQTSTENQNQCIKNNPNDDWQQICTLNCDAGQ